LVPVLSLMGTSSLRTSFWAKDTEACIIFVWL
jgi:hypothetical protein